MEKTNRLTTIILWALMAISVALFVVMVTSIDDETNPGAQAVRMITMNINWALIMFAASSAITILFALAQIFTDKSKAISAMVSVGILGVLLLVAYFLSSGAIPTLSSIVAPSAVHPVLEKLSECKQTFVRASSIRSPSDCFVTGS